MSSVPLYSDLAAWRTYVDSFPFDGAPLGKPDGSERRRSLWDSGLGMWDTLNHSRLEFPDGPPDVDRCFRRLDMYLVLPVEVAAVVGGRRFFPALDLPELEHVRGSVSPHTWGSDDELGQVWIPSDDVQTVARALGWSEYLHSITKVHRPEAIRGIPAVSWSSDLLRRIGRVRSFAPDGGKLDGVWRPLYRYGAYGFGPLSGFRLAVNAALCEFIGLGLECLPDICLDDYWQPFDDDDGRRGTWSIVDVCAVVDDLLHDAGASSELRAEWSAVVDNVS